MSCKDAERAMTEGEVDVFPGCRRCSVGAPPPSRKTHRPHRGKKERHHHPGNHMVQDTDEDISVLDAVDVFSLFINEESFKLMQKLIPNRLYTSTSARTPSINVIAEIGVCSWHMLPLSGLSHNWKYQRLNTTS